MTMQRRHPPRTIDRIWGRTPKPAPPAPARSYLNVSQDGRVSNPPPAEPPRSYLQVSQDGRTSMAPSPALVAKTRLPWPV
jgi:hypothetical protein